MPDLPEISAAQVYALGAAAAARGDWSDAIHSWVAAAHAVDDQNSTIELMRLLLARDPAKNADAIFSGAAPTALKSTIGALLMSFDQRPAERWLREAADEGDGAAAYNLGMLLHERGATEEAKRWWQLATERPDDAVRVKAANNLGIACLSAHDLAGAERWFRSVGERHPPAANNLAIVLQSLGRHTEAAAWSNHASGTQQLTPTQRLALAVRMYVAAAEPCPTCGLTPDTVLPVRIVPFAAPPEVADVLAGKPLTGTCTTCGTRFDVHAGFAFLDPAGDVAIAAPAERLPPPVRDELAAMAGRVVVCASTAEGAEAVLAHVQEMGAWLVDGFLAARAEQRERDWVRSLGDKASLRAILAAGLLVNGDLRGMTAIQELTALRAIVVAGAAIEANRAAPDQLDDLVPLWASRLGDRILYEAAMGGDRDMRLAATLALAWAADRGGPALDDDGRRAWAAAVLDRLVSSEPPADIAVFGDLSFIKRTVDPGMLLTALHQYEIGDDDALPRARAAIERYDLLGGMSLMNFERIVAADGARDELAADLAAKTTNEGTAETIRLLSRLGRLEVAETLYHSRLPMLERTTHAADAAAILARELNEVGRPQSALDVAMPIMSDERQERYPSTPDVQADLTLAIAESRRLMLDYRGARALLESVEAWLLDQPERRQHLCEVRFKKAKVLLYSGSVSAAREVLERLLGEQLPLTLRFDVLVDLGDVLATAGDLEASLSVQRRAAAVGAPIADWHRDAFIGLRMGQLENEAALGWDSVVLSGAEEMLAELTEDEWLQRAQVRLLMAEAAARSGHAAEATDHAEGGLGDLARVPPPGHEFARRSREQVHARLLRAAGRGDELERLVAASPSRSWMLPLMLATTRAGRHAWSSAREAVGRSWTVFVDQLLADELSERSVHSLRIASELQRWTGEIVLQQHTSSEDDLLWAAELQSGLVSGLAAWPPDERRGVAVQLLTPGGARAWLDEDVLTITTVAGVDEVMLIAWSSAGAQPLGRWNRSELHRVRREVAAVTKRGDPRGDPLPSSPAWNAFAATVGRTLAGRLPARHIVFAGTGLQGLPLHMVPCDGLPLCRTTPCSYAPSLLGLAGLRRSAPVASAERPRVGVLSVVRVRESGAAAEGFETGAQSVVAAARRHGSTVEFLSGPAASPAALGDLLAGSDIACISCHGLARPGFGAHALLLADGTTLPPQLVEIAEGSGRDRFVLDWERIPAPTPPAVLSAACSSGSGSTVEGGERVALDRSFLARGSRVFVGPLWDVGVTDGLELVAAALDRHLGGLGWADGWVDVLSEAGDALPAAAWAAFVTIGDWRT